MTIESATASPHLSGEDANARRGALSTALIVACVALAANLLWSAWRQDFVQADSPTYMAPARGLMAGMGLCYKTPDGEWLPEYSRTPVYPAFLALAYAIRDTDWSPVLLQKFLVSAMLLGWTWWLVVRVGIARRAALLGGLLCALDPAVLHQANHLMTETVYTALLIGGFVALWEACEKKSLALVVLAGAIAAASTLARPISILLFVPWGAYAAWANRANRRIAAIHALALCLVATVPVVAWMARNHRLSGVFSLSSISGTNMLLWRGAGVMAERDGITFEKAREILRAREAAELARVEAELGRKLNGMEVGALRSRLGIALIKSDPAAAAIVAAKGGLRMAFGPALPERLGNPAGLPSKALHGAQYLHAAAVALLGAAGIAASLRQPQRARFAALALATVAYHAIVSAGPEAYSRFRVPLLPILCASAAMRLLPAPSSRD